MAPKSSRPSPTFSTATLSAAQVAKLQQRSDEYGDVSVYEPEYAHHFTPWPTHKVKKCIRDIVAVAKRCATDSESRRACLVEVQDAEEFRANYQIMWKRLTQPDIAKRDDLVCIFLQMCELHNKTTSGQLTKEEAQKQLSQAALQHLMKHPSTEQQMENLRKQQAAARATPPQASSYTPPQDDSDTSRIVEL